MLRLCGCCITNDDADRLVAALNANGRAASLEAAATIRWGTEWKLTADRLEPDLRDALVRALGNVEPSPGLVQLQAALERNPTLSPRRHRWSGRLHNPRRRHCECLSDCWCKRTGWGQVLRWYIPSRFHSPVSASPAARETAR